MSSEAHAHDPTDPAKLWNDWNETTTDMRSSLLDRGKEAYRDPFGLYHLWMKPITFFEQWHNATSRTCGWMVGRMMNSRRFLGANCQFIETYMSLVRASLLVNAVMFQKFQIPTRSDLACVAKLVASLEERIYTFEDAFVNVEDGYLKVATDQVVEGLAEHLGRVEDKLDTLDARTSIFQQVEMIGDLAERMAQVEDKLNILLASLEQIKAKAYLESIRSSNEEEVRCKPRMQNDGTQ
ncbi:MAG TPA: hypothetical protein VHV10_17390 [Ktedonobacteraceae bacterium]|nr:hypothetical protein [Ktedonobacteraceae bacterium]